MRRYDYYTYHVLSATNTGDTIHYFCDSLEYQLQFEDHWMLETVKAPLILNTPDLDLKPV